MNPENLSEGQKKILCVLRKVYDPELHINLVDLGLVRQIDFDEQNKKINVVLSLTTPFCPLAPMILSEARESIRQTFEGYDVNVDLDLETPWSPDLLPPDVKSNLGL